MSQQENGQNEPATYTASMEHDLACPICSMTDLLDSGAGLECITCGHEWAKAVDAVDAAVEPAGLEVRDANGNLLSDGDSVVLIKDLKVKGGGSTTIKVGTKVTGIRLVDGDHEVDCKIDGQGIMLKAEYLKKA